MGILLENYSGNATAGMVRERVTGELFPQRGQ